MRKHLRRQTKIGEHTYFIFFRKNKHCTIFPCKDEQMFLKTKKLEVFLIQTNEEEKHQIFMRSL